MRKVFDVARAGFLGLLMACVSMAPVAGVSLVAVGTQGCSAADVQATIATVLKDLPIAIQIAEAIIGIVGAAGAQSTTAVADVTNYAGQISSGLTLASSLITQYQMNLAKAPGGVILELDAGVATVNQNLQAILTAVHVFDPKVQAAVGVAIAGIDSVLLGLESILPPSAAPQFPRVAAALNARGRQLGAITAQVPTPRHLAKTFNAGVQMNFPLAIVPVPKLHFLGIPV